MLTILRRVAASAARAVAQRLDPDIPVAPVPVSGPGGVYRAAVMRGHTLVAAGAAFDPYGARVNDGMGGVGRARCSCGGFSPPLPNRAERRAWHRAHKAANLPA